MGLLLFQALIAGLAAGTVATFGALTLLPMQAQADTTARGQAQLVQTAAGAGLGGLAGLLWASAELQRRRRAPWQGWRRFVVRRKHVESAEITSFEFCPVDGGPLPRYRAGQFLTLQLQIPDQDKPVVRTYSLSDWLESDGAPDHYRISVKREPAPPGVDVPPGLASTFLHEQVVEGTILTILPPAGSFVLDSDGVEPIVLVSNGVGITPMLAMVKAAVVRWPQRPIWFVHGCRNSRYHAFQGDVEELARTHKNLHVHVAYSRPLPGDDGHHQSQGYVDGALLRQLIQGPAAYYLCGSPAFMDSLVMALQHAGVDPAAIRFERFSQSPRPMPERAAEPEPAEAVTPCEVAFCLSGRTVTWDASDPDQSLLELAEGAGLQPAFACRAGVCGTCTTRVRSGSVAYLSAPSAAVDAESALICIARPASPTLALEQ